jgi:hypothetical protein
MQISVEFLTAIVSAEQTRLFRRGLCGITTAGGLPWRSGLGSPHAPELNLSKLRITSRKYNLKKIRPRNEFFFQYPEIQSQDNV